MMKEGENLLCLKKSIEFIIYNFLFFLGFTGITFLTFLPIYFLFNYHHIIISIILDTPFLEILVYSLIAIEILFLYPLFSLLFSLALTVSKHTLKYFNEDKELLSFKNFEFFKNIKQNIAISSTLFLVFLIFILIVLGSQFLIYISVYIAYYMLSNEYFSKIYDIFIFLFSSSFTVIIIILTLYLILPMWRKIIIYNNPYKILLILPKIYSLRFIKNGFIFEYFACWIKWFTTALSIIFIGYFSFILLEFIDIPYKNMFKIFLAFIFINFLIVYTSICSVFSRDKLEFPYLIDEDEHN